MLSLQSLLEIVMATNLVVRNIDEELAQALKERAASHGRSAEAEHREILRIALQRPRRRSFLEVLSMIPDVGEDSDFNRHSLDKQPQER
jgi:plasmid stability protein